MKNEYNKAMEALRQRLQDEFAHLGRMVYSFPHSASIDYIKAEIAGIIKEYAASKELGQF